MAHLYKEAVPDCLYHATDANHLVAILRHGIEPGHHPRWSMTNPNQVYLATDPDDALSYDEESDLNKDAPSDIAIFKINPADLIQNKLFWDENIIGNHGESWQYADTVLPFAIKSYTIDHG